jgi:hypothetical protein
MVQSTKVMGVGLGSKMLLWGSALAAVGLAAWFLGEIWWGDVNRASALGNVLGGFAAGSIAVWLWWFQVFRENENDARSDAAFIRALFLDVHATIRMIDWSIGVWTKSGRIDTLHEVVFSVEPLRPLLFEANLGRIERLDRRQAGYALLGHANLRIACECIQKLGEHYARTNANATPMEHQRLRLAMETLLKDIVETLARSREQLQTALSALDPAGSIAREFELSPSEKTKVGA